MGYVLLFIVVFVTVTLIKGGIEKKKRARTNKGFIEVITKNDDGTITKEMVGADKVFNITMNEMSVEDIKDFEPEPQKRGKIAELNRKMEEKTAWLEADTKRMQEERARRKAVKQAEKQAKIEFKNRNK